MVAKSAKKSKRASAAHSPPKQKKQRSIDSLRNWQIVLALALVSLLSRLPILKLFNLVTFDGTSYINQAKALLRGAVEGGAFPLGYPAFITVFLPVIGDGVRAAQVVSFVASVATAVAIFLLAERFVKKDKAILCALAVAIHPLLMRLSLMTFSESLYMAWVCLGLLFFSLKKDVWFGVTMGLAAITRPEAIGIFGVLILLRIREPRRLLFPLILFATFFALNAAYLSKSVGRTVILPKSEFFGTSAQNWQLRELPLEFEGKEDAIEKLVETEGKGTRLTAYFRRLPGELRGIHQYILPILLALALFGIVKRPTFLLAALIPFFFIPAFTVRSEARYLLPYIPVLILYGFIGADAIQNKNARKAIFSLIVLSIFANLWINRRDLTEPVNPEYIGSKVAGERFRDRVSPADKIADRKPFFAFYAGGRYVEIPIAPYGDVIDFLIEENVKLLSLHRVTTHYYRPSMKPLIYDRPAIMGELRFEQVYHDANGELIYERVRGDDPMRWREVSDVDGTTQAPVWSRDGTRIAFRQAGSDGTQAIYVTAADGSSTKKLTEAAGGDDPLTWSPDGRQVAFSAPGPDGFDVYAMDINSGGKNRITSNSADDRSPTWSNDGNEIAFSSNRTGREEIWIKNLESGSLTQLTNDGNNRYPVFSNHGRRIAWVNKTDVVMLDRTTNRRVYARGNIRYRPSWSPDDRFIALENDAWGSVGVYLLATDASDALLLTKTPDPTGMPAWNPNGYEIAVASNREGKFRVYVLAGLKDYVDRLNSPPQIRTFDPLPEQ